MNKLTEMVLFVFLLATCSTVMAISADDVNSCKQQARQKLYWDNQMMQINGLNGLNGSSNDVERLQYAYDACIQELNALQQRQQQIDNWQPQQQQQQQPVKKGWFN